MSPSFLLPDHVARDHGEGAAVEIGVLHGKQLLLTLGITRILQEESLQVFIVGSADGATWKRLAAFPPKSYCGIYTLKLDLKSHPDVRFLRADWTMRRWAHEGEAPVFGFHVLIEQAQSMAVGAA